MKEVVGASRFPCCVLLALSWNTTSKNPSTDKLSRAINCSHGALFHQSGRSHPLAVEFETGCLCGLSGTWYLKCQRQAWNFNESKGWWRITTMQKKTNEENMKVMLKLNSPSLFLSYEWLDLLMMMKMIMTLVASYKSLSPLPSLSERTGLIIPVGHFHLPSLPLPLLCLVTRPFFGSKACRQVFISQFYFLAPTTPPSLIFVAISQPLLTPSGEWWN